MASKNFVRIRGLFDGFYPIAKIEASDRAALSIKQLEAECKTEEQLVCRLSREKQAIKTEIDSFETKEYYCCANHEAIIFLIYCSRIFCYDRDEEQAIRQGLMLSERYRQVNDRLAKAKKRLPLFLSLHFHTNKKNVVFYELDEQPYGTPDKDYHEMRLWQVHRKESFAALEFGKLRQIFIAGIINADEQQKELQKEINYLENILDNVLNWETDQLFNEIFKLKGIKGLVFPEDKEGFHQLMSSCIRGEKLNYMLSPKFFDKVSSDISQGMITSPPVFYVTLLMYGRWLCDVYSGIEEISESVHVSIGDLFYQACHAGEKLGQSTIEKFRSKKRKRKLTTEEYYRELMQECSRQYQLYKELSFPDYFCFLEQKEKLKIHFINDCLYSKNIDLPVMGLKQAIALNEMVEFLLDEIVIHEVNTGACEYGWPYDKQLMVELFCYLAPDSKQLKQLFEMLAKISDCCKKEQIPMCFIYEEINASYNALIRKAVIKYKRTIEPMDVELSGCFITEQLRNIKYLCRLHDLENSPMSSFYKQIKQIQKDELKIAHELQCFHPADCNVGNKRKDNPIQKPFNFGYHQGPKELKPILTAIDLKMNMLSNGSTVDDFMEVLTCKDLSKNTKTIYIGFTIIKFAYLRKKLGSWLSSFTPANIERSGIFISAKEGPITANVLYNSKAILLEDSDQMDALFDAKY